MSYILDALKKADSERERGAIPGIHAQQVPYMAVTAKPAGNLKLVLWLIAGLLTIIVAALAWRMTSSPETPPAQVAMAPLPASARPVEPTAPVTVVQPSPQPESAPVVTTTPPRPEPVSKVEPMAKPAEKEKTPPPASVAKVAPAATSATTKAATKLTAKTAAPKASASAASATDAASTKTRVYTLAELPDDVQRDLPKLTISGGTYSSNPAQRLLIVNNQVFLEGGQPAPGVTVEQIQQNAAVLSFKGYRYRVAY